MMAKDLTRFEPGRGQGRGSAMALHLIRVTGPWNEREIQCVATALGDRRSAHQQWMGSCLRAVGPREGDPKDSLIPPLAGLLQIGMPDSQTPFTGRW
jgi:hypothetical protein